MIPWAEFPTIISLSLGDDDDMSNIIAQASFNGRLKSDSAASSTTGDLCTLTAAAGKDLYLSAAKIIFFLNNQGTGYASVATLQVNGTNVESSYASATALDGNAAAGDMTIIYEFKNLWHKVTPGQTLKINVATLDAQIDVSGMIQAVEVPTTENPVTYTGA